jgi:glycosyltransferase involved in cell wall biosynthesis
VQIDYRFKLFIAGKNMPPSMESIIKENLLMMGEVYDAASFVHDKAITVVPLLSGSGIRLKILEAMAASKLVISTTIGAQGIDYENGKNILIADTPEEFVSYFKKLAQNIRLYDDIKQNGLELIKLKYSNQAVIQRILTYYQTVIEKHTINS